MSAAQSLNHLEKRKGDFCQSVFPGDAIIMANEFNW